MKLIVFGATGGTGLEVVVQALERGWEVIAFVRSPEKIQHLGAVSYTHLTLPTIYSV